ncbi:MAG: DUF2333 family protein [Deferribacteres bacterium]|nr:DUF2333 family protein [candidate division KSB1 bacterium]MCB9503581.1 DUF2333 family protein [Deferribacteres bacterium]
MAKNAQSPKEKRRLSWIILILFLTLCVFFLVLTFYWSAEPELFDVYKAAQQKASSENTQLVTGYVTTNTLIKISKTILEKRGGYISNDVTPPGIFMDNIPNWEFGVLVQIRDFTKALRNDISRAQTQSIENQFLAKAEPQFNVDSNSWLFPSAENEYYDGIEALESYLQQLTDRRDENTQFFARADNLRDWLRTAANRLGSLSQRLSASVGQERINTNLAGEAEAVQSTYEPDIIDVKTPWMQIDDVFYEARGTCWALIHLLRAIEVDFAEVLKKKNATRSVQQIIRELEATQRTVWSPMVLNGSDFGFFANYSLVMSSYISRANAGIIDLRELLSQG